MATVTPQDATSDAGGPSSPARKRAREEEEGGEQPQGCDQAHTECTDETCWMCLYQTDDEAKRLMEFIVRSVGYIDTFNISTQDSSGNLVELKGAKPLDIERHIKKHILHPKVRIAVIIKELLQFQDHLHKNLVVEDAATGLSAVDKGVFRSPQHALLFLFCIYS
eukprot:2361901-Rhodomonas_salina.2